MPGVSEQSCPPRHRGAEGMPRKCLHPAEREPGRTTAGLQLPACSASSGPCAAWRERVSTGRRWEFSEFAPVVFVRILRFADNMRQSRPVHSEGTGIACPETCGPHFSVLLSPSILLTVLVSEKGCGHREWSGLVSPQNNQLLLRAAQQ